MSQKIRKGNKKQGRYLMFRSNSLKRRKKTETMDNNRPNLVDFGAPEKKQSIIKVIGVGGGGGNAVNHMYREGIHDVSLGISTLLTGLGR